MRECNGTAMNYLKHPKSFLNHFLVMSEVELGYEPEPTVIEGSCHCGKITFSAPCFTPFPFNICHCNTDRKTAGHGGYVVNIMVESDGLVVQDKDNSMKQYNSVMDNGELSKHTRHFCGNCGSALYASDDRWPQWVWPFAGSIDTKLPPVPKGEYQNLMLEFKSSWTPVLEGKEFDRYPDEGIEVWHRNRKLYGRAWLDDQGELLPWVTSCAEKGIEALEEVE
eukprot:TRINITY_DN1792_c0_g1_i1.p1 TRINITY_DN1792_c0_g1~~TRINITY_DN1792_c0_g1_i1.p1  ORF type:complete len:223 (+),score=51.38 TRINITY_DN1792_c0_g1_i1:96-764(+)